MRFIPKETIQKYSQTAGERNEIDEILEPVLLAQRIYGLQILDPEWSWRKYGFYRIANVALCLYITLGTIEVCSNTNDLNLIIEGIFTMLINLQMLFKLPLYMSERKKFQLNYLKAKIYIYDLIKKSPKREEIVKKIKLVEKIMVSVIVCPIASYLLIALWFAFNGNRVTLSQSTSTLMPMTSPYYELGLLIHLHFLVEASFCLLAVDFWFIFMCFFFFEASDVLVEILDVKKKGDSEDEYAKRLNDSLRKFYVLHVELMEYLNYLNDMFKWICLVPILLILVGTSLFLMLLKEELNLQLGAVMLPATGELFTYNWFGDRISSKAEEINMALLHFDWTSMGIKDQKKYYIMACYMNKKFSVRIASGSDLSLLTLSTIYKASYQMFTVFSTT